MNERFQALKAWSEFFLLQYFVAFFLHTCLDAAKGKAIVWPYLLIKPFAYAVLAVCLVALYQWHKWQREFREWEAKYPEQAAELRKQAKAEGRV